jgi:hypothetical protein
LARVKNSTMLLNSRSTSNFAASSATSWQFAAIAGGFSFLGKCKGANDKLGFRPQMNRDRDYHHIDGGKLENIGEQLYLKGGGCILAGAVPK